MVREAAALVGWVFDEWFGFLKHERRRNTTRIARHVGYSRDLRERLLLLLLNPRVGEFKQMIATLEAREAEHRKSGKSSSYLGWMLPGGGDAPSPAAADKEGKRDGDAGAASSSFSSILFGPSSSSSSAPDDADAARVASLIEAFNK